MVFYSATCPAKEEVENMGKPIGEMNGKYAVLLKVVLVVVPLHIAASTGLFGWFGVPWIMGVTSASNQVEHNLSKDAFHVFTTDLAAAEAQQNTTLMTLIREESRELRNESIDRYNRINDKLDNILNQLASRRSQAPSPPDQGH